MKELLNNQKTILIILVILLSGVILQLSRSQVVLYAIKNESDSFSQTIPLIATEKPTQTGVNPAYCIVYNETSLKLKNNIEATLHYHQKTYKSFDIALGKVDFINCPHILLTTAYLDHLGSTDDIEKYVYNGGKLFLMTTLEPTAHFNLLARNLGIIDFFGFTEIEGLTMTSNVLIGADGMTFLEDSLLDSSLNLTLENSIKIYTKSTAGAPLLWKNTYGNGLFITFNATLLTEKRARGLISGILSLTDEPFIYPIFNAKTFYIDDFPAPIAKGRNELIYNEFRQDLHSFYRNIWWSDMIQAASNYNLIYTGALIESYDNSVTPPFNNSNEKELNYLISYGRELLHNGGEVGLHGYNHQSLTMDEKIATSFGYNVWQSTEHMEQSLLEALDYTKVAFPSYTISSYVPPSNVLSSEGRTTLRKALPDLVTIASLYSEDGSNRSYIQEFEIAEDLIVEMPRISSGYFRTDSNEWEIANAVTSLGVFSHFIHPDDVISTDRSIGGWTEMNEEFNDFMGNVHTRYPWLQAMTATNAAYKQAAVQNSHITFEQTLDTIQGQIDNYTIANDFLLRTDRAIHNTKNCSYKKIDANSYLVTATSANFEITLK